MKEITKNNVQFTSKRFGVYSYKNYSHRKKCTAAKSAMISDKHWTANARKGRTTAPWKTWVDKKDTF